MKPSEISNIKKLIKDIRYKLNELERAIEKNPREKNNFGVSNYPPTSRKRNPYRSSE